MRKRKIDLTGGALRINHIVWRFCQTTDWEHKADDIGWLSLYPFRSLPTWRLNSQPASSSSLQHTSSLTHWSSECSSRVHRVGIWPVVVALHWGVGYGRHFVHCHSLVGEDGGRKSYYGVWWHFHWSIYLPFGYRNVDIKIKIWVIELIFNQNWHLTPLSFR
jgi:hypothetical protein